MSRRLLARLASIAATAVIATAAPTAASPPKSGWIHPPAYLDTFSHIFGSRQDGFTADHWTGSYWANTLYPPRRQMLFTECPHMTVNAADLYACQTGWDDFYTFLAEHRDGPAQYPFPVRR